MALSTRGILNPTAAAAHFTLSRHAPSPDLSLFVERYWIIRWDLRGEPPYVQETLPFPCVNLALERGRSGTFGVTTGKFVRRLEGRGEVFGIKLRPGAFFPFAGVPVARFTDTVAPLPHILGVGEAELEGAILGGDDRAMVEAAEHFLRARLPAPDMQALLSDEIVGYIAATPGITRVEHLVRDCGGSKRSLQRLFQTYVGVSPKWVIGRFRLHEAAERLAEASVDWAALTFELGYFDQAHFIKDFKALVGLTPLEYARRAGASR